MPRGYICRMCVLISLEDQKVAFDDSKSDEFSDAGGLLWHKGVIDSPSAGQITIRLPVLSKPQSSRKAPTTITRKERSFRRSDLGRWSG